MNKASKYGLIIIGIIVLIFVIAIIVVMNLFDPNDYKNKITQYVAQETGLKLSIDGKIRWSLFPWLGVKMTKISLLSPADKEGKEIINVKQADINIKLLPLLRGETEIGKVVFKNANIYLIKDKQGKNNWQHLEKKIAELPESTQETIEKEVETNKVKQIIKEKSQLPPSQPLGKPSEIKTKRFNIRKLIVINSTVHYKDLTTQRSFNIHHLNLEASNVGLYKAFPISGKFFLVNNDSKINLDLAIQGHFYLDPNNRLYKINKLNLTCKFNNPKFKPSLILTLTSNIKMDLKNETLSIKRLTINTNDLQILADVKGNQILTAPILTGHFDVMQFNLRNFLTQLNIPINIRDTTDLANVSLTSNFELSPIFVKLTDMSAKFGNSSLTGNFNLFNFVNPNVNFNFHFDMLDLDSYLLKHQEKNDQYKAKKRKYSLPFIIFKKPQIKGEVQIDKLAFNELRSSNIRLNIFSHNDILTIDPLIATLYDGKLTSSLHINIQSGLPVYELTIKTQGIKIKPLITASTGKEMISGTANLSADLNGRGTDLTQFKQTLTGPFAFVISDGRLSGLNLPHFMDVFYKIYKKDGFSTQSLRNILQTPAPSGTLTEFQTLNGKGQFTNGILNLKQVTLQTKNYRVEGYGKGNLNNRKIDIHLMGEPVEMKENETILKKVPIHIGGTYTKPIPTVDMQTLMKKMLEQTKKPKPDISDELKNKIKDELENISHQ